MGHSVSHGDRRSEWAEVGHGAGHGTGRRDRSGLKWVVGMAKVGHEDRRLEIGVG